MKNRYTAILMALIMCSSLGAAAQDDKDYEIVLADRKFYTGSTFDGAVFSTSILSKPGTNDQLTTLRFSMVGLGTNLHYDVNRNFGVFTGIGLKNAGFIEKISTPNGDSTVKRRILGLTTPLGVKIGNLRNRKFIFLGGGVDYAFNYKEKAFMKRSDKDKFNEWFSERTSFIIPYAFAGVSFDPGIVVKLQYYPTNFLNSSFTDPVSGIQPYAGYNVNILMLTLGLDIHYQVLPREIRKRRTAQ